MTRIVLTIDTATPAVSAAIVRVGDVVEILAESRTEDARAHAERLTPNVLAALSDAGLTMADLQAVVVGCGPGPFTGLRVGMATAAAYGHALDIPVHGVCSLDGIGTRTAGGTLVVTDARRRELYWARYHDGVRIDDPSVNAPAEVPTDGVTAIAGSPAHAALFDLPLLGPHFPEPAGLVAAVADWDADPAPLVPLYLRRPDAKTLAERGSHVTTQPVVLDALTRADAQRCADLEEALFPGDDPWPANAFLHGLAESHTRYFAARADGKLIGYAGVARLGNEPPYEYEVHTIGVDPDYQGHGIGRRLLGLLLALADADKAAMFLEVRTDNATAIGLYESEGFVTIGLRKRYYATSGADAYTMRREEGARR